MLDPNIKNRLKAEIASPYKGLRQFVYIGMGASGLIGAFVFFFQILAGRNIDQALPNFALQVGIVAIMAFLWKWERKGKT
ncbi:DUF3493 domain-containing protein [Cylindrospermopsis curvispora]|uniref:DUF3493 domain-containing protein n=1 Tax=Cylindrospermopsis curvispora GIHE-G1 TaxID=2666332 RepID=A0A7H0EWU3_9CYAN|nr:DUF3493 domain-containing protein [Cylindrospermopsis curvispora]QNP28259.1 DUF3493 domain-containing protein [Cylindrospermopsis curvispora GIHE-G1]